MHARGQFSRLMTLSAGGTRLFPRAVNTHFSHFGGLRKIAAYGKRLSKTTAAGGIVCGPFGMRFVPLHNFYNRNLFAEVNLILGGLHA